MLSWSLFPHNSTRRLCAATWLVKEGRWRKECAQKEKQAKLTALAPQNDLVLVPCKPSSRLSKIGMLLRPRTGRSRHQTAVFPCKTKEINTWLNVLVQVRGKRACLRHFGAAGTFLSTCFFLISFCIVYFTSLAHALMFNVILYLISETNHWYKQLVWQLATNSRQWSLQANANIYMSRIIASRI